MQPLVIWCLAADNKRLFSPRQRYLGCVASEITFKMSNQKAVCGFLIGLLWVVKHYLFAIACACMDANQFIACSYISSIIL